MNDILRVILGVKVRMILVINKFFLTSHFVNKHPPSPLYNLPLAHTPLRQLADFLQRGKADTSVREEKDTRKKLVGGGLLAVCFSVIVR